MAKTQGTTVEAQFERVVDGDTIRVVLPSPSSQSESLRIMALDTEETHPGGTKPVTPWGHEASAFAKGFFSQVATVTIEFPGQEPPAEALVKHRDNYGRLLAFVHRGDDDYQETMIAAGYSPYFMKYGHAPFADHRARYEQAERLAQRRHIGVWDQQTVNGSEMRNYAALGTWWRLRGRLIDHYRALRAEDPTLLDTRSDYAALRTMAEQAKRATVFSELRSLKPTRAGEHTVADIGSEAQPFSFFIPNSDTGAGREIVQLLLNRYISGDEHHPRLGYAYVTGELDMFRDAPQMVLTSPDQLSDNVQQRQDVGASQVRIASLLVNPVGKDAGAETVSLRNPGPEPVDLSGWKLQDASGRIVELGGELAANASDTVTLKAGQMPLNNRGDNVMLIDAQGRILQEVSYEAGDVHEGQPLQFD